LEYQDEDEGGGDDREEVVIEDEIPFHILTSAVRCKKSGNTKSAL